MYRAVYFACIIILATFIASCNSYEKVLKSANVNYKLTKANEYFDKKQYLKANTLYESLLPVMKGTRNFEPLYFRFAYSFYYQKDYLAASYHFNNFTDYFPASKDLDEAEYLHAVCLSKMSLKPALDQTNSLKAMEAMQSYINTHPDSKRQSEANTYMDDLRRKLEQKESAAARLYYNIGQYKAASIAYKSVINNFPESLNIDFYHFMIIRSFYRFARASVKEKQEERFSATTNAFVEFKERFSDSKYIVEAERIYKVANNSLNKIRNEHQ